MGLMVGEVFRSWNPLMDVVPGERQVTLLDESKAGRRRVVARHLLELGAWIGACATFFFFCRTVIASDVQPALALLLVCGLLVTPAAVHRQRFIMVG